MSRLLSARPSARRDEGFTIIELTIAMLIMIVVTVPLVAAFVVGITGTARSAQDATNSADAQLVSSYFERDVASADTVSTAATCGGNAVVTLRWTDGTAQSVVSYVQEQDTTAQSELGVSPIYALKRLECTPAGVLTRTVRLARSLTAVPTVACDGVTPCTATTPRNVSITLAEAARAGSNAYSFSVSGTRKVVP